MTARYIVGDVFDVLASLPENSVDLVCTSPPFLALRSYLPADHPDKAKEIGAEPTPGEFIDTLLDVTEALDRVLAPHGSICVELGDTYSGSGGENHLYDTSNRYSDEWNRGNTAGRPIAAPLRSKGGWPQPKSLCLIPELYRMALVYGVNPLTGRQTPPWRVRNVVRWHRPNPPVGALGDKFRPATTDMVIACNSAKRYFDLDAVRTDYVKPNAVYVRRDETYADTSNKTTMGEYRAADHAGAPPLDTWIIPTQPYPGAHYATFPEALVVRPIQSMCPQRVCRVCGEPSRRILNDRNRFSSRQIELAAHIKECRVAAGVTSAEINERFGYKEIAKNWERTDEHGAALPNPTDWMRLKGWLPGLSDDFDDLIFGESTIEYERNGHIITSTEKRDDYGRGGLGLPDGTLKATRKAPDKWTDCGHNDYRRGVVLDPFVGSGTVLEVASGHGRDSIGIDLDARNAELAQHRVGMFLEVDYPESVA